jgi:hypothetical protein
MIIEVETVYQEGNFLQIRLTNGNTIRRLRTDISYRLDSSLRGNSAHFDTMMGQLVFSSANHCNECVRIWNENAKPRPDQKNPPPFEPLNLPEPEHPATA